MVRTFSPFGTVSIGGTIIFDATGGLGTYTVARGLHRHPDTGARHSPKLSIYTSGRVHSRFGSSRFLPILVPAPE